MGPARSKLSGVLQRDLHIDHGRAVNRFDRSHGQPRAGNFAHGDFPLHLVRAPESFQDERVLECDVFEIVVATRGAFVAFAHARA